MNILIASYKYLPDIGGIEINSELLAYEFKRQGHYVKIMTMSPKKEGAENIEEIAVFRAPSSIRLFGLFKWADIIFENNPTLRLSWPAIFFKKPLVIALCTYIQRADGRMKPQDYFKKTWLKKASAVIAVSKVVKEKSFKQAIVISNPYRNLIFKETDSVKRTKSFVFLGRLVSDKGVDVAIHAFHKFLEQNIVLRNTITFTIIGDGPEYSSLESLTKELELEKNIIFRGAMSGNNLVNALNEHLFMIVPSRWEEPFGNVALEGMACGCIPIVSDGGGLPDAVGNAGILFKRNSIDDLCDRIMSIFYDDVMIDSYRRKAYEHLERHSPKMIAKSYLEVFKKAIDECK